MFFKIKNIGNTCYFNSAIQMFLTLKKFNSIIKTIDNNNIKDNKFLLNYKKFTITKDGLYLYNIFKNFNCKNKQMDSNELILKILETIENESISNLFYMKIQDSSDKISNWINYDHIIDYLKDKNVEHYPKYLIINLWQDEYNKLVKKIIIKENIYKIVNILCFIGNDNNGHYFIIHRKNNKWYKIDDELITEFDKKMFKYVKIITIIYSNRND